MIIILIYVSKDNSNFSSLIIDMASWLGRHRNQNQSQTNDLLREILLEIRQVKAHFIPQKVVSLSSPTGPIRNGWTATEPATKGDHKEKPRWYKENTEEYTYEFPALSPPNRPFAVASAGGGEEDKNENCPAEDFSGPPQLPNATRNKRLMGRMSKEDVAGLSREDKKRRCELKKMASEERKASRPPEEQAKIDSRVAAMQAARAMSKIYAGGEPSAEERQTRKRKNRRNRTRKN